MKINMKIPAVLTALLLLGAFSLYACQPAGYVSPNPIFTSDPVSEVSSSYSGTIERYIDREAGVVCYIIIGSEKGGIDCMPIGDTKLR